MKENGNYWRQHCTSTSRYFTSCGTLVHFILRKLEYVKREDFVRIASPSAQIFKCINPASIHLIILATSHGRMCRFILVSAAGNWKIMKTFKQVVTLTKFFKKSMESLLHFFKQFTHSTCAMALWDTYMNFLFQGAWNTVLFYFHCIFKGSQACLLILYKNNVFSKHF